MMEAICSSETRLLQELHGAPSQETAFFGEAYNYLIISHHKSEGQNRNMQRVNTAIENGAQFGFIGKKIGIAICY
jgi:hypothetical protein